LQIHSKLSISLATECDFRGDFMSFDDVAYYRRRARDERDLAATAATAEAAKAHEELARLYEGLVERSDMLPRVRDDTGERNEAGRAA
jgi:hypothetical protein